MEKSGRPRIFLTRELRKSYQPVSQAVSSMCEESYAAKIFIKKTRTGRKRSFNVQILVISKKLHMGVGR